jgi:hypothetical protein
LAAIDLAEVAALNGLWGHGRAVGGNRPYREQRDLHAGAHKARHYKKERERARWPTGSHALTGAATGRAKQRTEVGLLTKAIGRFRAGLTGRESAAFVRE